MRHGADVAALLVDHDQRAAVTGLLDRAGQRAPVGGVASVRGAEQDHPGRLASPQPAPDVLGPRGAREARDRDLTDLLPERELVDGLARGLEVTLLLRGLRSGVTLGTATVIRANGSTEEECSKRRARQRRKPPPPALSPRRVLRISR